MMVHIIYYCILMGNFVNVDSQRKQVDPLKGFEDYL